MRKSRFADRVRHRDPSGRLGVAEALFFDIRVPENEDDVVIGAQRVAALHHVPLLLGIAHLLGVIAVLVQTGGTFTTLSAATVVVPIIVALGVRCRRLCRASRSRAARLVGAAPSP